MCGVFGVVSPGPVDAAMLARAEVLQWHRGPDARRQWTGTVGRLNVGLAHQRLAIIDLSPLGVQPMLSPSGRSLIAYNGEIYNYRELRVELAAAGVRFATQTDTEVIAAACELWGPEAAFRRMNGMWALCWLDFDRQRLILSRDRFGKKPLYLARGKHGLAFGSEIKALLRAVPVTAGVNAGAVAAYLGAYQVDWDNETFFTGISKMPAASFATIDASGGDLDLKITRYWSIELGNGRSQDRHAVAEQLRDLIDDAVRLRLRSDVPVGLLLSGGLDSSAIAASASLALSGGAPLTCITAVSSDPSTDESAFSRQVATHVGANRREVSLDLGTEQLLDLIGRVTEQNDEPVGGFACVAQYLLMRQAKELGITVLLSGQGADESFCGYRKYAAFHIQSLLRDGRLWAAAQQLAAFGIKGGALSGVRMADAARYLPRALRPQLPPVAGPATRELPLPELGAGTRELRERQIADLEHLSVPALTHWEDRNSMAWSREVRDPFLDYRIVEFGVRLPVDEKIARGYLKYALRRAVADRLPAEIVWRREKRGFTTPEARLLRAAPRDTVQDLIGPDSQMVLTGLVDPAGARARLALFQDRPDSAVPSRDIFQLMSLELWLRAYSDVLTH
jgi:asparagine synthase (glutamine-hydrolysing)